MAPGVAGTGAAQSTLPGYPSDVTIGNAHVLALAERFAPYTTAAQGACAHVMVIGDVATASVYTDISRGVDRCLQCLEAHLDRERDEPACAPNTRIHILHPLYWHVSFRTYTVSISVFSHSAQQRTATPSSNSLPRVSLLKGGGAMHGIGEKFAVHPVTGTGSVPVHNWGLPLVHPLISHLCLKGRHFQLVLQQLRRMGLSSLARNTDCKAAYAPAYPPRVCG